MFGLLLVVSLALFAQVQAAGTASSSMWSLAGNVFPRYSFYFARAAETAVPPAAAATPKKITADHWFHVMEMPNGEVMIPWDDERV